MRSVAWWVALLSLVACGPRQSPAIDVPANVTAPVGVMLNLPLHASANDAVTIDFDSPDLADLKTRTIAAQIINYADGEAMFLWLPLATDVGDHQLNFTATADGLSVSAITVITVTAGPGAPPTFREPSGEGTTLDLARQACTNVLVEVEDDEAAAITLALEPPVAPNASLQQTDVASGLFRFCPSVEQVTNATIYPFTLSADDGGNPKVEKSYTVVVRPAAMVNCTTSAPTITTTPHSDITTDGDLHVDATIGDDIAVTGGRVLWTTAAPLDAMHPDLNVFAPLLLARTSGDTMSGQYEAIIPNPVVADASGTAETIYYVIQADDSDPPDGCAHETVSPASGTYSFTVTRP